MNDLYNSADYIELTIKCLFQDKSTLQKALELRVTPEDFGMINVYRMFVDVALDVGVAPINDRLCLSKVKMFMKKHNLGDANMQDILNFWEYIYREENITAEYVCKHLAEFIKFRRYQSLKTHKDQTPEQLVEEATKLVVDINLKNSTDSIKVINPFEQLMLTEHRDSLSTGFSSIDATAKGLQYQELGIILGHSGSGKTAMAVFSAIQNAREGKKVLYLSLEEPAENITNRLYSNAFRISYSNIHTGVCIVQDELKEAFYSMPQRDKKILSNLSVHDLRSVTPVTPQYIASYLDKLYEDTGYHPDLVYIDQLDYLTCTGKYDSNWEKYAQTAFEVDDLCNHLIGGQHMFSVWLLHQAGGKMTRRFSNAEISGFKGVIKPADMVLAIGRDSTLDTVVSIFSLKSRHAKNFQFDYFAELEFMNFEEHDGAAEDRTKMAEQNKPAVRLGNFKNVPSKAGLLPQPGGGFHN
jgi:replicative DNA helicase